MLEENISEKNGFIRLALGVGMTACGIAHLAKENGSRSLGTLFVTAGAMKIAEGIFLYCPAKALMNSNVKDAVTSSMQDFMDGDSLMAAFRSGYESASSQNASQSSSSNSSSGSSNNSSMQNMAQTASKVAETVEKTTPPGSTANTAAKTVQAVANSQKSQSNQGNQGNQNKQNNQKQNNKQS